MNSLILWMTDNHKLLDHTSVGKLTVNELFETGQTTLDSKDKKTIHRFLEIGHFPIVNKLIYKEIGRASVGKECRSRWSPYH